MRTFIVSLLIVAMASCSLVEMDLDNGRNINLTNPIDSTVTTVQNIEFRWDTFDLALNYHLQVVTPNFEAPESYYFDTILEENTFLAHLDAGNTYQWRVKGMNNSSETAYSTFTLQVDSSDNLCENQVQQLNPVDASYINDTSITFSWEAMINAETYELLVAAPGFDYVRVADQLTSTNQVVDLSSNSLNTEGTYRWKVKAYNASSFTCDDNVFTYNLDYTAPDAPTLSAPANNAIIDSLPTNLSWSNASDVANSKIWIYESDSVTLLINYPRTVTENTFEFTTNESDSLYFWKVAAIDSAGNESEPSTTFKLYHN